MTTKREAYARQEAWRLALHEGRVVRHWLCGTSAADPFEAQLTGYPTVEQAQAAVVAVRMAGDTAEIAEWPEHVRNGWRPPASRAAA